MGSILLLSLAATGCLSLRYQRGATQVASARSVAVLDLSSVMTELGSGTAWGGSSETKPRADIGNLVEEGCLAAVIAESVRPVEGIHIAHAIARRMTALYGKEQTPEYFRELGRMSGADSFITGSLHATRRGGQVDAITLQLVSAASGEIAGSVTVAATFGRSPQSMGERACRALLSQGAR